MIPEAERYRRPIKDMAGSRKEKSEQQAETDQLFMNENGEDKRPSNDLFGRGSTETSPGDGSA